MEDGFHLWSETFDRQRVNVFAIQAEIATAVAGVLNEQLGAKAPVPDAFRISVKAYDDYLRGRALLRARSDEDLAEARRLFESVTAAHADYAPGWAALAITTDALDHPGDPSAAATATPSWAFRRSCCHTSVTWTR